MRKIENNIILLHTWFKRIVEESNRQDYLACKQLINNMNSIFIEVINNYITNEMLYTKVGCSISKEYVTSVLSGLMKAQENEDYVFYADLVELQLIPILNEMQIAVREILSNIIDDTILSSNLKAMESSYNEQTKKTYQSIVDYIKTRDKRKDLECVLEPTSSGSYTLKVINDNREFYLHSNNNPSFEGRAFASRYYNKQYDNYVVVGLSLGYHILELIKLNRDMKITIIESKLEIIYQAFTCVDLTGLINNKNISFIYDKKLDNLACNIVKEDSKLLMHRPSLKYLNNKAIVSKLENILEQEDYIKRSHNAFYLNTLSNIRNCNYYVDELKNNFEDKRVIIVAAGPSLDGNVDLLKSKPDGVVVVATGTIFHKLMNMGIRPDYVIITDAYTYWQVDGLLDESIPIMLLATAARKIGQNYKGDKYLICQHEADEPRKYAEMNNYCTYETGGSVATTALDVVMKLGAKEIAFIGLDLAYPNNKAHASDTKNDHVLELDDMVKVESVFGEAINTNKIFIKYISWFERYLLDKSDKCMVFDATEGGARVKGMEIITLEKFLSL